MKWRIRAPFTQCRFLAGLALGILAFPPFLLSETPSPAAAILLSPHRARPAGDQLLLRSHALAQRRIPYRFGGTSAKGMDCSGSVQHLFQSLGIFLPRTSEAQANHLARTARLWRAAPWETEDMIARRLQPGDLLFWSKENDPRRIGHVMMFVRRESNGRLRLWGARGRGKTGINGSGVDFFDYRHGARPRNRLLAYGRPAL